ncbi:THAP domain-containing protein 2-like [Saccostrea cucullata]|uniref:THAP domain-containing protein 2-like n=1 Tax=Saccostrea cuccullata TaxID=36930 RepID=UPI002ED23ED1
MPQCAAFNCNIRSQKGVAIFLFPKDTKYRRIRVQNLRRDGFIVSDTSRLCAKHFTDDQFSIHQSVAKKCGYKKIDLKPNAVPTIFDFPKSETKKKLHSLFQAKGTGSKPLYETSEM